MKLPRLRCLVKWPFKVIYLEGESQFTGVPHHELLLQRLDWSTPRGILQEAYTPFLDWLRKVHLQAVCYKNFSETCAWPYGLQLLGLFQPMLKRPGNIPKEGKRTFLLVATDLVPTFGSKMGCEACCQEEIVGFRT
ncbi:uncharacterized protein LOC105434843 isoform X2 [Cucumis sativus]|uniref:uncharacterized protein LOC105434843 isoform X2 n=1 Tax=Cucumis sativus TaxID=3659 RepID=UPI0005ED1D1B|nr:uncharacterized protein LOC105434843 isoform X2 [Cucumis sativus]